MLTDEFLAEVDLAIARERALRQRQHIQALGIKRDRAIGEIRERLDPPKPSINRQGLGQWGRPSWYKPENETPIEKELLRERERGS